MKRKLSRRCFLSKFAAGAAGLLILRDSQSVRGVPANERINVALIGIGGRGRWFLDTIPRMENVVALCDVDNRKLTESVEVAESYKYLTKTKPKKYRDFRRMLDEMGNQIDAVIVATPDHTHAVIAATAMKKGKHVYVEKPIAHDVAEARALRHIARQRKVATQMGNQGMATFRSGSRAARVDRCLYPILITPGRWWNCSCWVTLLPWLVRGLNSTLSL